MDSRELLYQYSVGAYNANTVLTELKKLTGFSTDKRKLQEAAKARYAISFVKRLQQHKSGEASTLDLCLCVRELSIVFGRIQLPEYAYKLVKENAAKYGFICESPCTVSTILTIPPWLAPKTYIEDVYRLSVFEDDLDTKSAGDKVLSTHTVFADYKNYEQKISVHTAINLPEGNTLLVSQPTGGGKSLITQVLSSSSDGLTLVVVPTVALALDQFEAAKSNLRNQQGIFCFRGEQKQTDKELIIAGIKNHTAKLVFSSPEAIAKNQALNSALSKCAKDGYLKNVVVDEAHIVPDWGIFFRPDFQIFSIILKRWKEISNGIIRTYMLSATLSDDVVDTLFSLFESEKGNVQVRCDSLRKEPRFYFCSVKSKQEQDEKTIEAIEALPKPLVVYVLEPHEAKDLQKQLTNLGYKNIPVFTGETKDSDREKILKKWKSNEFDVVIATSAFGIGVDKPDVRTIIHACVPENLSRFYQEVGRAGRDRFPSLSVLLPYQSRNGEEGDTKRALGLVKGRVLRVETMVARWEGLMDNLAALDGDVAVFDTAATPNSMTIEEAEYAGNLNMSWNINLLLFLHRVGFIQLTDAVFQVSTNSYLITAKLLRLDVLNDIESLKKALDLPRQRELDLQLLGYRVMRDLVQRPTSNCWGHIFKQLFPLSKEVCNGCPADERGRSSFDVTYKLRERPNIELEPVLPNKRLKRKMGSYQELIVTCDSPILSLDILETVAEKAELCGIGTMVIPAEYASKIKYDGMLLTYEEFHFTAKMAPYLFYKGIICCFDKDQNTNYALMQSLDKIKPFGYACLLLCNETMHMPSTGKSIADSLDANSVSYQQL